MRLVYRQTCILILFRLKLQHSTADRGVDLEKYNKRLLLLKIAKISLHILINAGNGPEIQKLFISFFLTKTTACDG